MSYQEGEIIGFRVLRDQSPEVLVRTVKMVMLQRYRFDALPDDPVEILWVPEFGSEWRPATELDLQIMKVQRI